MATPYTRRLLTIDLKGIEVDWREGCVLILNDKIAVRLTDDKRAALTKLLTKL
jgi:hypothetical protein